jgi:hypothetical protein
MARIYLDICCFNRPFDDQTQLLVRLQTEAKLAVQDAIRTGIYEVSTLNPKGKVRSNQRVLSF